MNNKYPCVCCGFLTRLEPSNGDYDICPVCFWEDDPVQNENFDTQCGANAVSLMDARENFKKYGAMEQKFITNVRLPNEYEYPDK
jgi:hypothetical protein